MTARWRISDRPASAPGREVLRWSHALAGLGAAGAITAAALDRSAAGAAAGQTWPAFVLVIGLLLVGLVAAEEGLFAVAGGRLAAVAPEGRVLFLGSAALIAVVTAILNLDTAVAFLTPVLVHTCRRRREDAALLLSLCLLMANAASLPLPGSNLTNLIVLDGHRLSGATFFTVMAPSWLAAILVTTAVVGRHGRAQLRLRAVVTEEPQRLGRSVGLVAVAAVTAVVLAVPSPAPVVAAIGVVAVGWAGAQHRVSRGQVARVVDVPVLVGLFGLAVALGSLGRAWTGPAGVLAHLDPWATAALGAAVAVVVNNLPAAALLGARLPPHPFSLLIGLDIGPNLFVSGSLAWVLWSTSARAAGARPPMGRTVRLGLVAVPLSLALAVGALLLSGSHT